MEKLSVSSLMPLAVAAILDSIFGLCLAFSSRLHNSSETEVGLTSYITPDNSVAILKDTGFSHHAKDSNPTVIPRIRKRTQQSFFSSACKVIKTKQNTLLFVTCKKLFLCQTLLIKIFHLLSPHLAVRHSGVKWDLFSSLLPCPVTPCRLYYSNNGPVSVDST